MQSSSRILSAGVALVCVTLVSPAGSLRARTAILTVSTAVLAGDALKLPAELAPWRDAASFLPLGRNEKLFFEIVGDAPFADESQLLGNPRQRTASYYIRPLGSPVIECFFGGDGARFLEESGHAAGFDFALERLAELVDQRGDEFDVHGNAPRASLQAPRLFASDQICARICAA